MEPFLSIVLTAYNVEDFIEESILSVINSTFKQWELIIVNDGSTDNTGRIIDQYTRNQKILACTTENKGLGAARNFGMRQANGEYILFLDGDDMISRDLLANLYNTAQNKQNDIICFGWQCLGSDEVVKSDFYTRYMTIAVWNKCYKKSWLLQKEIHFMENVLFEDVDYSLDLMLNKPTFTNENFSGYVYRFRKESISNSVYNVKKANDTVKILSRMCDKVSSDSEEVIKQYVTEFWWRHTVYALNIEKSSTIQDSLKTMLVILKKSGVSKRQVMNGGILHDIVAMTIPVLINLNMVRAAQAINSAANWLFLTTRRLVYRKQ